MPEYNKPQCSSLGWRSVVPRSEDSNNKNTKSDRVPLWIMGALILLMIWLIWYGPGHLRY